MYVSYAIYDVLAVTEYRPKGQAPPPQQDGPPDSPQVRCLTILLPIYKTS